jgi:hypothetical protein
MSEANSIRCVAYYRKSNEDDGSPAFFFAFTPVS